MIDFTVDRNELNTGKTVTLEDSQKEDYKACPIGKDVQAYLSNRLLVLHFHGVVLSDKVKGLYFCCIEEMVYGMNKGVER